MCTFLSLQSERHKGWSKSRVSSHQLAIFNSQTFHTSPATRVYTLITSAIMRSSSYILFGIGSFAAYCTAFDGLSPRHSQHIGGDAPSKFHVIEQLSDDITGKNQQIIWPKDGTNKRYQFKDGKLSEASHPTNGYLFVHGHDQKTSTPAGQCYRSATQHYEAKCRSVCGSKGY